MKRVLPTDWSSERTVKRPGPVDLLRASNLKDWDVCGRVHWKSTVPIYSQDIHPANEDLEEFHFGRVSAHQRQNIESHLHHCNSCRGLLEDLREFIVSLSNAIEWKRLFPQEFRRNRDRVLKLRAAKSNSRRVRKSRGQMQKVNNTVIQG